MQETIDLTVLAFDLAQQYRTLVFVVCRWRHRSDDGTGGIAADATVTGTSTGLGANRCEGRSPNLVNSLYLGADSLETLNLRLQDKLHAIESARIALQKQSTSMMPSRHCRIRHSGACCQNGDADIG